MKKVSILSAAMLIALVSFAVSSTAHAADPAINCEASKLKEAGKYANCRMKADSKAVKKGESPDYSKCLSKFGDKWDKAETKAAGACPSNGDEAAVEAAITTCMGDIATSLAPPPPCAGAEVGGACWFLGGLGDDCDTVCVGTGLSYDEATRTYAGSDGTGPQCEAVLDALGVPADFLLEAACGGLGVGCVWEPGFDGRIRCLDPTTSSAFFNTVYRACACQ